jgi:predicted SnoaL-like aldol condensation-catalyzing enzyme
VSDDHKATVRRFVEGYQTGHDVAVAESLLADDFVDHTPFGPLSPDRNGVLALFAMLFGEFMGIPPTGREVAFDVIDIVRVRDGQLVEHWNVVDAMALMTQLGALPTPA